MIVHMRTFIDLIEKFPPHALSQGVKLIPPPILVSVCALSANLIIGKDNSLASLSGQKICLELTSPSLKIGLILGAGHFWPAKPTSCDVCIRGEMRSFVSLLLQTEDADALFFDRRLEIEGNTEVALLVRHTLENALYRKRKYIRLLLDKL